ncbi:unnamed protein product [Closterium sp. NIES-54]
MLKVVLNNQSPSLTKDQLLTSLRSEEMRIGVAPRSDGVATFGAGTKVGSNDRANGDKGVKHGGSDSSSDTNSGRWGQGKGKAGVLDLPWGSKGMAPRGLHHGCWDEGHAWQRCPHRPKGGISTFLKWGGRGSNGKAQVADEEEQDDKVEVVVREAVAAVGEEQPREGWWIDSGASHNFTPYASDFKSKIQPPKVRGDRLGDGRVVKAVGMGEVPVVGAGGQLLRIQKVHLVPEMLTRLLSVPHLTSRDVHMELWGPVRTSSLGGVVYVLSLIDDFTRQVWSFPLPNKESATVAKVLRQWHKDMELRCGRKLKAVRSDRGGEFLGDAVKAWKAEFGIKTQLSVADTPQQNGVVERWHRTMAEGIRTLLVDSGLPARLWGCMGSVMLHGHEKGGKLDARAVMCVCVGVDMESKGWRMLDPSLMRIRIARDADFLENVMWKDWDKAKGFGELLQDAAAISQLLPLPLSPPSAPADDVEMPPSSLPPAPLSVSVQQQPTPLQQLSGPLVIQRRSAIQATSSSSSSGQRSVPLSTGAPPSLATTSPPPVTSLQVLGIQSGTGGEEVGGYAGVVEGMLCLAREVEGVALAGASTGDVPRTLAEALRGPEGPAWKAGAEKEVNAMRTMGVWDPEPVDLPPGKKAIGVRYVFRRKTDKEDKVVQHKVRLVAKGYTQEPEKDYDQVFAPVGKLTSGRVLLAEAAVKGWHVQQEDVDHSYLNAVLQEEVYVRQPEGFDDGTGRVYRLHKALYGLKQAPRAWNEEIGTTLIAAGFDRIACDEALYIRFVDEEPVYVLVYVDDLLLVSPRLELIGQVKEVLAQRYQMKDLGEVSTYLGVEVHRSVKDGWLDIGQEKYVRGLQGRLGDLLKETHKVHTPMSPNDLSKIRNGTWSTEEGVAADVKVYQSLIGSLMYAAVTTRPDMSFTVNTLAQSCVAPRRIHMRAALRALRYLVDTADRVIRYERQGGEQVAGYTDSDWGGETDGKSRSAYIFKLGGGGISWYSKKQDSVAASVYEAEYKALSEGAKEAIWLRSLLAEMHVGDGGAVPLLCDNEAAVSLAHNPVLHQRTKHIKVAWHFVRDAVRQQEVEVHSVRSHLQDADMLTKALPSLQLHENLERIGMRVMAAKARASFAGGVVF